MNDETPGYALAVIAFCGVAAVALWASDAWRVWIERRWSA